MYLDAHKKIEGELHYIWSLILFVQSCIYLYLLYEVHGINAQICWYHVVSICAEMNRHLLYNA